MKAAPFVPLQDLAIIGDRNTCALLDKSGNIVWYCPTRFDFPSLFANLLDPDKGGFWGVEGENLQFLKREYNGDSGLLRTCFRSPAGELTLEDWMPIDASFTGICRQLTSSPAPLSFLIRPRPDYAQTPAKVQARENHLLLNDQWHLYASHPLEVEEDTIRCRVPAGESAWMVLGDGGSFAGGEKTMQEARETTLQAWHKITGHITYHGPYEEAVRQSLRVLRLLTFAENGGIIAAATTSLPEVPGGDRNYDYRYVWLRDAAMITSALTRAGSDGEEERQFLSFICSGMHEVEEPVVPFFALDTKPAPEERELPLRGYLDSRPVRVGNNARNQLQLDAISNVLLAAKVIYNHFNTREHWETVRWMANYLVEHWREPDHGIWEETPRKQYTTSKVVAACSLGFIAEQSQDEAEQQRWREAATQIRAFVAENCLTSEGAYAVFAGSEAVDISAVLFPIWTYTEADAPEVLKTIEVLDRNYCRKNLYYRHLVEAVSRKEGAFLAGTFWMAEYWVMRKNWKRFEEIMEAALAYQNDVGLMPEEADPDSGAWLGNLPQAFVHASLIGAVVDYKQAKEQEKEKGQE